MMKENNIQRIIKKIKLNKKILVFK